MIKRFIIALVFVVLVVGGIVGFNMFRDQAIQQFFATMKPPASAVSTVTVEPVTWTPGIDAIGTVSAAQGVDLTVVTAGVVKSLAFAANQVVEAGATLLELDAVVQQADLAAAQAQADLDTQALERARALQGRGVGSTVSLESASAAASVSAAQVARLQAVLDQKRLEAPFKGTMGIPRVEVGQYVSPGTTVATIQDLETMRADFSLPEQQLGSIRIGQQVRYGLEASDMPFTGEISGIEPKVDPTSRLVTVRATLANPDGRLSPGQFIRVRVVQPEEKDVLALPQTALVASLYGDYVFVVRPADETAPPAAETPATPAAAATETEGAQQPAAAEPALKAVQVFVKAGRRNDGLVEILEGIKAGDQVVTAGQNRLSTGGPVTIDNTVTPTTAGAAQ